MKCATNTMYEVLDGLGWKEVAEGVHPRPTEQMADVHFTICRNPYDRAVSIWASTCLRNGDRYNAVNKIKSEGGNPEKFEDFVKHCLLTEKNWTPHNWLFSNQMDWSNSTVIDAWVHIENLKQELEAFTGPLEKLPKVNTSKHKAWYQHMTPKIVKMINEWAEPDFWLGYNKL